MPIKIIKNKKITIQKLNKNNLKQVREFTDYINFLVAENAKILIKTKQTVKQERKWLKEELKDINKKQAIILVVKDKQKIIGITNIKLGKERESHIGYFGISIRKNYRNFGLGTYLMQKIFKLAQTDLKPKPKIIQLKVFGNNKTAIRFYKKMGFKQIAVLPKQIQFNNKLIDEIVMSFDL